MADLSAPAGENDFYFVPADDPETAVQRILELVKTAIPRATRSCRSRMTTTRRPTTATSAISSTSIPRRPTSWRASTAVGDVRLRRTRPLVPAYATIHKSQGAEYPAVIIPVLTQHYAMLQRNLLYTGVNRGKARGSRRPEEGPRHRRSQRIGPATLVEAGRVALEWRALTEHPS